MKDSFLCVLNADFKDISPIFFSRESYETGHGYAHNTRNFMLIQYVEQGEGMLVRDGKEYTIKSGDTFILPDGGVSSFHATSELPLKCLHVAFFGELAKDFYLLPAVFGYDGEFFLRIAAVKDFDGRKDAKVASLLMELYSSVVPRKQYEVNDRLIQVKDYIDKNYNLPITVESISSYFSTNRSYLSRSFKEKYGKSPKEYLLSLRLQRAKQLLNNEGMNVTEAAFLCGFNSQSHFSRIFKKWYGYAPKAQMDVEKAD